MNNIPVVSTDADENWRNDAIQFPRLLAEASMAELFADPDDPRMLALAASMDVTTTMIYELLTRAETVWDAIKAHISTKQDNDPPQPFVVCEIIRQQPRVSVHPTYEAALLAATTKAERQFLSGLSDSEKREQRVSIQHDLATRDSIMEGEYEIHILNPTEP